jgi:hypothetical protein
MSGADDELIDYDDLEEVQETNAEGADKETKK